MNTLLSDLRLAARMLFKAPTFALLSIAALALGIGANTVMFSVANTVLLQPLTYRDPDRLVFVDTTQLDNGAEFPNSPPDFYRMREREVGFESLAGLYRQPMNLTGGQEPERIRVIRASADLFPMLGVKPVLGRVFTREDEQWGASRVAVISHDLYRARFGGGDVLGRTLTLDGQPIRIVGVLPRGFSWLGAEAQVFVPLSFAPGDNLNTHNNYFLAMVGKLRPGVTVEAARAGLRKFSAELQAEFPESRGLGFAVTPMREIMVGKLSVVIPVLLCAVAFVLLIACANLAHLVLVRSGARAREIAVRVALGATRGRILRQLLTENLLLSALGGAAGLLLAFWAVDAINALGQDVLPRMRPVTVDGRVLAFTLLLSAATAALVGLLPALRASSPDLRDALTDAAPGATGGRHRLGAALVVAEVALSLVLLAGAGLLLKSMNRLLDVRPGFEPRGVLTAEIDLPARKYLDERLSRAFSPLAVARASAFFDELLARVRASPGVSAAGAISSLPLAGDNWGTRLTLWDRPLPATALELPSMQYRVVSGDVFAALGIRILRGRAFDGRDGAGAQRVAIVSQEVVRRFWNGVDPIGRQLSVGAPRELDPAAPEGAPLEKLTVVGVADDVRYGGLDLSPVPVVYAPYAQGAQGTMTLFVAARAESPLALAAALREQVRSIDPEQPVANVSTFTARLDRAVAQPRLQARLLGLFAAIAVVLAALGIYGVMAVGVAQRTREIGIRIALGARRSDVIGLVLRRGLLLTGAGVVLGLCGGMALTRLLRSLLFGVAPGDPGIFLLTVLLLAAVAAVACWVPARRAARVDPAIAMRTE
ncbi:MAG TPA: ABC transporter permease [Myxococcales bacterium]|nr:ABC transporter permease [Myxococcales bacterium]